MAIDLFYPHPEYDFKATERWLEKKARKGRHLVPGGNLNGFAAFEKGEPAQVRYRLVPTGRSGYRRADDDPPAEEELELFYSYFEAAQTKLKRRNLFQRLYHRLILAIY